MERALIYFCTLLIGCQQPQKKNVTLDFCHMLQEDQNPSFMTRREAFKYNFEQIIDYTELNGFPNYDFASLPKDSCKTWAVMGTFIHIAQQSPELLFKTEIVDLLSEEMRKGNIDPEDIYPAFKLGTGGGKVFCDSLKPFIDESFIKWKMNSELKERFKYQPCSN